MRYAKLKNGYPSYAPNAVSIDGNTVINPTPKQLTALGYLPVVLVEAPQTDEQHYPVSSWTEENGSIVQKWTIEAIPPESPTDAERIAALEESNAEMAEELRAAKILLGLEE